MCLYYNNIKQANKVKVMEDVCVQMNNRNVSVGKNKNHF